MRTSCTAEMRLIDVAAHDDASVTSDTKQSFSDLGLFAEEEPVTTSNSYATLGFNQFVLDGSKKVVTGNESDIGYWSLYKSGANCKFAVNPKLRIDFTEQHTSIALTLTFADTYPAELIIRWYTLGGTLIKTSKFNPTGLEFVCVDQVKNYGAIEFEFTKTNMPGQYIHLQHIVYGRVLTWADDLISKASITEEVDVTSNQISINTASVEIVDENNDFDISNPEGGWQSVQKNQAVHFTENIDEDSVELGTFYIKDFSFADNKAKFQMMSPVGLLDRYQFEDGEIYVEETVENIVDTIMADSGVEYVLDDELKNIKLTGYLKTQTKRAALQQVAFVIGAAVDDSRSDKVHIYKPSKELTYIVGTDRKFNGKTKAAQTDYVSGVSIEISKYSLNNEVKEIYNDVLPAGTSKINFGGPYQPESITVTGGTLTTVKTNYAIVEMADSGNCLIEGKTYDETKFKRSKKVAKVDSGEIESIKTYGGLTLYNGDIINETLSDLLKYHNLRKKVDMRYLINHEHSGSWIDIKDREGRDNASLIEKQTIDLTGGFIATATCRGYTLIGTEGYFTGQELFTNTGVGGAII